MNKDNCFSIIFDPEITGKSLDLVAKDAKTCWIWVNVLNKIITATKSIEIQKEYELYLRNQVIPYYIIPENQSAVFFYLITLDNLWSYIL
jgi:hypothetical protein